MKTIPLILKRRKKYFKREVMVRAWDASLLQKFSFMIIYSAAPFWCIIYTNTAFDQIFGVFIMFVTVSV
jgi:hypothetical protein